jgi:hypothetical protein
LKFPNGTWYMLMRSAPSQILINPKDMVSFNYMDIIYKRYIMKRL